MRIFAFLAVFAALLSGVENFEKYDNNCTKGDKFSCLDLGMILYYGEKPHESEIYLKIACEFDLIAGCDLLGLVKLQSGDESEAVRLFTQTCEKNSSYGCLNLGLIYQQKDPQKVRKFFVKSCKMREIRACEMLNSL